MIKVILFDAVGLVTNQEPLSSTLERDYGIPFEDTLPFFRGPLQDCVAGQSDLREVVLPFLEKWEWKGGVDAFLELWFTREHNINEALIAYIQNLRSKGILCFLATNQEKIRFAYFLDKMGFAKSFDKTYCSAHLGHKKPDQQFFVKILKDLPNIMKEEILFWDDKEENVEAAREFGINAEVYSTLENFREKMQGYSL